MTRKKKATDDPLYYLQETSYCPQDPPELYTWEDAQELAAQSQQQHPEKYYEIREFNPL